MLAVLRSQYESGQAIGAMITASHKPGPDNGVKLVDPAGEMLEAEWEAVATSIANCEDKKVPWEQERIVVKYGIGRSAPSLVIVGQDTRVSSPSLAGVASLGVECVLADKGWDCEEWLACYQDLPNLLAKVTARDRNEVTTSDAERKVVTHAGLQEKIDAIVAEFSRGCSFV